MAAQGLGRIRRDARAVEWAGLENRCTLTGTVGSNPTLSASIFSPFLSSCLDMTYVLCYYSHNVLVQTFLKLQPAFHVCQGDLRVLHADTGKNETLMSVGGPQPADPTVVAAEQAQPGVDGGGRVQPVSGYEGPREVVGLRPGRRRARPGGSACESEWAVMCATHTC